jgi:hypothetical protein
VYTVYNSHSLVKLNSPCEIYKWIDEEETVYFARFILPYYFPFCIFNLPRSKFLSFVMEDLAAGAPRVLTGRELRR